MKKAKNEEDKDCWFCLKNPKIERDLIINDKWTHFYIALPKGPVCDEHFLIVPKEHIAHSVELTPDQEQELAAIKDLLINKYLLERRKMDYFLFERNMPFRFEKAAHMNIQVIGFPQQNFIDEKVKKLLDAYEAKVKKGARSGSGEIQFCQIVDRDSDLRSELCDDPSKHFFYLELPGLKTANGRQKLRFYTEIPPSVQFDMQFGRVMAAHLLDQRNKVDWKNC